MKATTTPSRPSTIGNGWVDVEEVPHPCGRPVRIGQRGIRLTPPDGKAFVKGTWKVARIQQRGDAVQVELAPVTASSHTPRVVTLDRIQALSIPRPRRTPARRTGGS